MSEGRAAGHFDHLSALRTIQDLDFVRVCGSEGERRGLEVIARRLDETGVGWRYQVFHDKWLEPDDPHLLVRGRKVPVRPAMELSFLHGTRSESCEKARVDLDARLAPADGSSGRITVLKCFDPERPVQRGAVAQLLAFPFLPEMEPLLWAAQDWEGPRIPTAVLMPDDVPMVRSAVGEEAEIRWSGRLTQRRFCNLAAEIPGSELPEEIVVMGAHIDSFPGTVGSSDDAAGCAVLLEAAKWFAAHRPARTVRLIWFTGEELDARGSRTYVKECVADPRAVKLMVNVDSGCELHTGPFTLYASDESVVEWARGRLPLGDMEYCITKGGGTDARSFIDAGIPALAVEAPSRQSAHLPDDNPPNIDPAKVRALGSLSLAAAIHAACEL